MIRLNRLWWMQKIALDTKRIGGMPASKGQPRYWLNQHGLIEWANENKRLIRLTAKGEAALKAAILDYTVRHNRSLGPNPHTKHY